MAQLKDLSVAGIQTLAHPAALGPHPIRKNEFDAEFQSIVDENGSLQQLILQLRAEFEESAASVLLELTALANADGALSQAILALQAEFQAQVASIILQLTTLANAQGTLSSLLLQLRAEFEDNVASVALQLIAISNSLQSVSQATITLQAQFNANVASVQLQLQALSNANGSASQALLTLTATVNGLNTTMASVQLQLTALADANGSTAQSLLVLTATVNGLSATLTQQATVTANALGQLYARYAVTVDLNGRISGFELLAGTGQQSRFIIRADVFGIVNPDYPANTFPINVVISGNSGNLFQTLLGTGTANVFTQAVGGAQVARAANVWSLGRIIGVGVGSGYADNRLRRAGVSRFIIHTAAQCKSITVWYRVIGVHTDWRPFGALGFRAPGGRDFESVSGTVKLDIAVGAFNEIEFGFNGLDGNANGDTGDDAKNNLYQASLTVEVSNI